VAALVRDEALKMANKVSFDALIVEKTFWPLSTSQYESAQGSGLHETGKARLRLRDLSAPDTVDMYIEVPLRRPPIGLLAGTRIRVSNANVRVSQVGKLYLDASANAIISIISETISTGHMSRALQDAELTAEEYRYVLVLGSADLARG
jgi:hypothetical protein